MTDVIPSALPPAEPVKSSEVREKKLPHPDDEKVQEVEQQVRQKAEMESSSGRPVGLGSAQVITEEVAGGGPSKGSPQADGGPSDDSEWMAAALEEEDKSSKPAEVNRPVDSSPTKTADAVPTPSAHNAPGAAAPVSPLLPENIEGMSLMADACVDEARQEFKSLKSDAIAQYVFAKSTDEWVEKNESLSQQDREDVKNRLAEAFSSTFSGKHQGLEIFVNKDGAAVVGASNIQVAKAVLQSFNSSPGRSLQQQQLLASLISKGAVTTPSQQQANGSKAKAQKAFRQFQVAFSFRAEQLIAQKKEAGMKKKSSKSEEGRFLGGKQKPVNRHEGEVGVARRTISVFKNVQDADQKKMQDLQKIGIEKETRFAQKMAEKTEVVHQKKAKIVRQEERKRDKGDEGSKQDVQKKH